METFLQVGMFLYLATVIVLMGAYVFLRFRQHRKNRDVERRRAQFVQVNSVIDQLEKKHRR